MHRALVVSTLLRLGTTLAVAVVLAGWPSAAPAQESEQLRRELDAVKEQLRRVEQQMKQQEELIRRLSGPPPAPAPPPRPAAAPAAAAPGVTPDVEALKQMILADLRPQLAAASKTFPSQFNPAISFVVDTVFSTSRRDKSNFEFRSGELGLSASVDPFARAYAFINGTQDDVELEEAAIVTTSLPWNLTLRGGRFFAEFGRLSTFHDHDLPFINRPRVLDTYVGGESQADGVELNWLAPIPHYLTFTLGMYNKIGGENDRVDNTVPRNADEFTYLLRAATSFSFGDAHTLDLGITNAYTPAVAIESDRNRNLFGADLTYRYTPLASAAYRGLIWGTEVLVNREGFERQDSPGSFRYKDAVGLYSYLEARLTRRIAPGFLFEFVQDLDRPSRDTKAYSPYLTFWLSGFQRIRLQYTHTDVTGRSPDDAFFLQWTAIIGSHAHTFRDR